MFFLHVMVEELLKLLIDKVDGDLLEAVVFEDLEAGDVEHGDEVGLLQGGVDESVVTLKRNDINLFSCCCLKVDLHLMMSHLKILSKIALAIPPTAPVA